MSNDAPFRLEGTLQDVNLTHLLQILHSKKRSGRLLITTKQGHKGELYFRNGELYYAQAVKQLGDEVISIINTWKFGTFIFEEGLDVEISNVKTDMINIIMSTVRNIDEWSEIEKKIPSIKIILDFVRPSPQGSGNVSLRPIEYKLLEQIDGKKTIERISEITEISIIDVCTIFYRMISVGLVTIIATVEEKTELEETSKERGFNIIDWIKHLFDHTARQIDFTSPITVATYFFNQLMQEYEISRGLFDSITLSTSLNARLKLLAEKYTIVSHIKENNNRLDITELKNVLIKQRPEERTALIALGELTSFLLEDARNSFSPKSAEQRYFKIHSKIFTRPEVQKLKIEKFFPNV